MDPIYMNLLKTIVLDHYGAIHTAIFIYMVLKIILLDPYGLLQTKMDQNGTISYTSVQNYKNTRPLWTHFAWIWSKSQLQTHLDPVCVKVTHTFGPIQTTMGPFCVNLPKIIVLDLIGPIWTHFNTYGSIQFHYYSDPFRPIQIDPDPNGLPDSQHFSTSRLLL